MLILDKKKFQEYILFPYPKIKYDFDDLIWWYTKLINLLVDTQEDFNKINNYPKDCQEITVEAITRKG